MVECEYKILSGKKFVYIVLIDTWWNVNMWDLQEKDYSAGFNRYMVECEFVNKEGELNVTIVLIDTWWNVNSNCLRLS